jgi:hypothetical protein
MLVQFTGIILDSLITMSKPAPGQEFENPIVLTFLTNASMDKSQPPDKFFTKFEYDRLQFSTTGCLKNQTEDASKMCIGVYLLLRILVNQLLFRFPNHASKRNIFSVVKNCY